MYDFEYIINRIRSILETHKISDGNYARWLPTEGACLEPNPYGCSDAANILYTIGEFPREQRVRDEFAENLISMQDTDGMYREATHIPLHTTAHCMAALELFDKAPARICGDLMQYKDIDALNKFLDDADKLQKGRGHTGATIYVIMNMTGQACDEWNKAYFEWFWDNTDPETGMWHTQGKYHNDPLWQYMGDGFHYFFNIEFAKMPLRYPEKLIDSCIKMYEENSMPEDFGKRAHFLEADWIYCLNRASRQTPHRFYEIKDVLRKFLDDYYNYLSGLDWDKDASVNDLHMLFGLSCAAAELQAALPGEVHTVKPLRLVLERRPFI